MICPKCGYEQEERLDCIKCGIVFNKYLAIHSTGKPNRVEPNTFIQALEGNGEEAAVSEFTELRQGLRELQRRWSEVEFERAERNLIKGEIKALDQKFQGFMESLNSRLGEMDSRIGALSVQTPTPAQEELDQHKKIVEDTITDNYRSLLESFSSLESRLASRDKEVTTRTGGLVEALEGQIAGLRDQASQLSTRIQSIEIGLSAGTSQNDSQTLIRADALEGKILQINDQASQAAAHVGSLEALLFGHAEQLSSLKKDISALIYGFQSLQETTQNWADKFCDLEKYIAKMQVQIQEMEGETRDLREKVQPADDDPPDPEPSQLAGSDAQVIREDLAQIRQFMGLLMKKL